MIVCDGSVRLHDNSIPKCSALVEESRLKFIKAYHSNLTYDTPFETKEGVY